MEAGAWLAPGHGWVVPLLGPTPPEARGGGVRDGAPRTPSGPGPAGRAEGGRAALRSGSSQVTPQPDVRELPRRTVRLYHIPPGFCHRTLQPASLAGNRPSNMVCIGNVCGGGDRQILKHTIIHPERS